MIPPNTPSEWALLLKSTWETRARSAARDFYVASHPGWNDAAAWERQARVDLDLYLYGLDRASLRSWDVLEIGCGVGRLAGLLAPLVRSYTGLDISPGMLEEARKRLAGTSNTRFLETDGLGVPSTAADRRYQLALAPAVFIHCPRPVIERIVRSTYAVLAPGGQLRLHLRGDPETEDGMDASNLPAIEQQVAEQTHVENQAGPTERVLIDGHYYMGDVFSYRDAQRFLKVEPEADVVLYRPDRANLFGWVERR
ncbi:MAG: class I SAM-dependent methyltransferase [Planctomycetes bacterium]|nr:class I SAM-dependent methyltransferase [Planctomycetota bacterium]